MKNEGFERFPISEKKTMESKFQTSNRLKSGWKLINLNDSDQLLDRNFERDSINTVPKPHFGFDNLKLSEIRLSM